MKAIKTADIYDEYEDSARVLVVSMKDFGERKSFSGLVRTVKCFEDNSKVKELSQENGDGKILVIDGGGSFRCALMGDIVCGDLVKNGWEGVVINGCVRDSAELRSMSIGVKALGVSPRKSAKRGEGAIGVDIEIGGQNIAEGDRLYADEDGIIVLSE